MKSTVAHCKAFKTACPRYLFSTVDLLAVLSSEKLSNICSVLNYLSVQIFDQTDNLGENSLAQGDSDRSFCCCSVRGQGFENGDMGYNLGSSYSP